jgi:simple sugar transport system permease protein
MTTLVKGTVAKRMRVEAPEGGKLRRVLLFALLLLVLVSFVRWVTGANDITSTGTFGAALRLGVPIAMTGLGGLYAERAGIVNIGLEGMMILGTWFGAWAAWKYGNPWYGVVGGTLGGAAGGLLHAVATVTFNVDHVVSGVAINILGAGVARYLSVIAYANANIPGAGATQSPHVTSGGTWSVPVLSGGDVFGWHSPDALRWLEQRHWFLVSDTAGMLHGLTSGVSWLALVAVLLLPLSFFVLWRTAFGLRLRSVGESPMAAESLGVPVYTIRYLAVVISGGLAGFGGAFLAIVGAGIYREGQTGGRGFIGMAAMIFGNWRPGGLAAGASLFGYADALQLRSPAAVHALLLFLAIVLALIAVRAVVRRRMLTTAIGAGFAVLFFAWYFGSDTVPGEFVTFTPHLTTLLVLAIASQRLRPPMWDGLPYRKGMAT